MEWYAIQVTTGKENEVKAVLDDYGIETVMPNKPIFLRHAGTLQLIQRPLMPGYIVAKLNITNFYQLKRNKRLARTMIRICGNGYDAVSLNDKELSFFKCCGEVLHPLQLKADQCNGYTKRTYYIINPPPWAESLSVEWYDICRFIAKLHIKSNGVLEDHAFKIAAYNVDYGGIYSKQLKDLSSEGFGQSGPVAKQVVTA